MTRPLKLWNGNVQTMVPTADRKRYNLAYNSYVHAYACANSRAEVVRILQQWSGGIGRGLDGYVRDYWNAGAWGNSMEGIAPEIGLWVQYGPQDKPVRVWPQA